MGFSWTTFFFELINFALLIWLLNRLVFRPLGEGIATRRAAVTEREGKAKAAKLLAEESQGRYEEKLRELDTLQAKVFQEAVEQAAIERARLLEQARDDAQAERSRVDRLLEAEREASVAWVGEAAIDEAVGLAGALLMDLVPDQAHAVLIDRLVEEVRREAPELLAEQTASGESEVDLEIGQALSDDQLRRLRAELEAALGTAPRLAIRDVPDLRAGAVLRVGNRILDASVGGGLDVLRARARSILDSEDASP